MAPKISKKRKLRVDKGSSQVPSTYHGRQLEEYSMDFRSPMQERIYEDDFVHRSIIFSKTVQFDTFASMGIKEMWERIGLLGLCELSGSCCKRSISLFYVNMYIGKNNDSLKTYLYGRELSITSATVNAIIGFPFNDDTGVPYYQASRECDIIKAGEALEFLKMVHRNADIEAFVKPSSKDLNAKAKVVHNIISHIILPCDGHRDLVSYMDLYVMEKLYTECRFNSGFVILNHMKHISTISNTNIGYSALIQKILEYFHVSISAHESMRRQKQSDYFNKRHLSQMRIVESDGIWDFRPRHVASRLTCNADQSIDTDDAIPAAQQPPNVEQSSLDNPAVMQKLDMLINNVQELTNGQRELNDKVEKIIVGHREIRQGMLEMRRHYLYLSARVFNWMKEHHGEPFAIAGVQAVEDADALGAAPPAPAPP